MRCSENWDPTVDHENTKVLKRIINEYGWPDLQRVSAEAAEAAWLIVQHADHDLDFQKQCLELMKAKFKNGRVESWQVAYLTDRVLVNEGKPQMYGTQFYQRDGAMVPRPIAEMDGLDGRRARMGLESFDAYSKQMTSLSH